MGGISTRETSTEDTQTACEKIQKHQADLLLFAGGDGTARDIYSAVGNSIIVLGIPSGVKMYSAVYAQNPKKAGELAALFFLNRIKQIKEAEIMDMDEAAIRKGMVSATLFGYLKIPFEHHHMRGLKTGTSAREHIAQQAIAEDIVEHMDDKSIYIIGPGTTTRAIMEKLKLDHTLLGVDLVQNGKLLSKDCNERQILGYIQDRTEIKIIITPIGGQGYLFGRGNQQISADIIQRVGKKNIIVAACRNKINTLQGKPFLIDTGHEEINEMMSGYINVVTGYKESVVYRLTF
jgi:predicted polyphosphate/ATP-dependent NAD kinase